MKYSITLMLSCLLNIASAQNTPVGIFQANSDIGNPKKPGSAVYDPTDQSYTLKGGGYISGLKEMNFTICSIR